MKRRMMEVFKFVQYADPQLGYGGYEQGLANLKQAVKQINELDIDFTFFCGDLVHDSNNAQAWSDFKEAVGELEKPFYAVPGNHDVMIDGEPSVELRELFEENFNGLLGQFLHKGYHILWFDSQAWLDERSSDQMDLIGQLMKHPLAGDLPKIIFAHHPLFLEQANEESAYFNTPLKEREQLLELFKNSEVKAYLCGHTHRNIIPQTEGFIQVSAPSTCRNFDDHPFGFYLWEVDEEGLNSSFVELK